MGDITVKYSEEPEVDVDGTVTTTTVSHIKMEQSTPEQAAEVIRRIARSGYDVEVTVRAKPAKGGGDAAGDGE